MTEEENKAIEKIKELEKLTREESKERNLKETQKLYKEYADYYLILLNLIEKLKKEIEEKTTIIFAGAEKVKSLQKENEELKNKVIKRDNDIIYLEETAEKEFITKKEVKENLREKIEYYQNEIGCEKSYLEQGIICEEEYKDRVKVYNSYIFILNKLLEEE